MNRRLTATCFQDLTPMRYLITTARGSTGAPLWPVHAKLRRPRSDDELIAHLLIHTWILITGRMLRSDVPPQDLTEQELIDFWADDYADSTFPDFPCESRHI
jgi:hypothetical protein